MMFRHGEKFAVAAALALFGGYAAWAAVHEDAVAPVPDLRTADAPYAERAQRYASVADAVDAEALWTSLHTAGPIPADTPPPRPPDEEKPKVTPPPPVAGAALIDSIAATLDGVTLSVRVGEQESFELQRRIESGDWDSASTADANAAFGARYEYRARAVRGDSVGDWCPPVSVVVPPQFRWELRPNFDTRGAVQVIVVRYERPLRREVSTKLWQLPGERIGVTRTTDDDGEIVEIADHRADGTRTTFNFDTGATLRALEPVREERSRRLCRVVAGIGCLGCNVTTTLYSGRRIVIESPDGAAAETWIPAKAPYPDDVCEKHAKED